ncbi:uncharacterized protein CCR75_008513 [Bremia lactucae]|uniref:Chromo domain-containing protein n=1 Tax=Bremia lactucae TaxID=4779 RepID=A0A976IKJ7_BRELC|nr:hypothetical protein CCR75_008513 [Bremia lactucae]
MLFLEVSVQQESSFPVAEFAKNFADKRQIIKTAQANLARAQEKQKDYYDRKRSNVTFKAGDMVMLDAKNLKKIGPFEIEAMINDDTPASCTQALNRLVESFRLKPNKIQESPDPESRADPETGSELHIVEALVKKRVYNKQPEWLVKWHGLPEHESTWEKEKNIRHDAHWRDLVQDFKIR